MVVTFSAVECIQKIFFNLKAVVVNKDPLDHPESRVNTVKTENLETMG